MGYVRLLKPSTGVDALEGDGRYPDPLRPVTGAIDVPANEATSVYALVHVPASAPAGRYAGTVDLGPAGTMPLAVEVAPVTASRDGYTVVARLNQIQLAKASGVSAIESGSSSGSSTGYASDWRPSLLRTWRK